MGTIEFVLRAKHGFGTVSPILICITEVPLRLFSLLGGPKFVFAGEGDDRRGEAIDSLISEGAIISGSRVRNSILSPDVFVHSYAEVTDSIIMSGVEIGRGAKVRRAIIDKYQMIPEGELIGYDSKQIGRSIRLFQRNCRDRQERAVRRATTRTGEQSKEGSEPFSSERENHAFFSIVLCLTMALLVLCLRRTHRSPVRS